MTAPVFATPEEAEAAFYRAFENTDLDAMMAVWSPLLLFSMLGVYLLSRVRT